MSEQDIALALNCSQSIVAEYLFSEVPWVRRVAAGPSQRNNQPLNPRPIPRSASVLLRYRSPRTEWGIAGERKRLARHLAREIRGWVTSIELSDAQRKQVIELAGFLLDATPLTADGEYLFDKSRAFPELLSIWMPKTHTVADSDFETMLSRWLASWIRFWVAQPIIWYGALDLEFAHFGEEAKAA